MIETDPRFTDTRQWLGSDYLLDQLATDPARAHKRLGDGFYEQKLVREQVGQLTGRRFLDGYANDEDMFKALMNAGLISPSKPRTVYRLPMEKRSCGRSGVRFHCARQEVLQTSD